MKQEEWARRVRRIVEASQPTCRVCGSPFVRLRADQATDRPSCAEALREGTQTAARAPGLFDGEDGDHDRAA